MPADRLAVLRTVCLHAGWIPDQIARATGMTVAAVQWHLDALAKRRFVVAVFTAGFGDAPGIASYHARPDGRAYLGERGLL